MNTCFNNALDNDGNGVGVDQRTIGNVQIGTLQADSNSYVLLFFYFDET